MKVIPVLKGYTDKHNKQLIQIMIRDGSRRLFKSTGIRVTKLDWDEKKLEVKPSHPNAKTYNTKIKRNIIDIEAGNSSETKFPSTPFMPYINTCISQWERTKASETIRQHWSEVNKLKAMPPKNLSDVNLTWLNKYTEHLYSIGNKTNTVWKTMKFVKTVIRKARREKLIESNPFDLYEMPKYRDPVKLFLTKDQVLQVDKFCQDENRQPELIFAGTWFVIGCWTGLRFKDMTLFDKKKNIRAGRLITYTHKTKEVVSMLFSDKLKTLFERIDYKPIHWTNVTYSRHLKTIAKLLEIDINFSAHLSRHSFGTMAAEAGLSIEVTAKLMGHTDLKSTSIYYRISNKRIDREVDKM